MRYLSFIFDYICPYCYVMIPEIKRLEETQGFVVDWIPMEIYSDTPIEGVSLMEYLGPRKVVKSARLLEELATTKDIPFYLPEKLYNTKLVNLLTAYGRSWVDQGELIDEIFRRVFVYNENISDHNVVYKICLNLGVSYHDFMEHVRKESFKETTKRWEMIVQNQRIDMVPTLLEGDRMIHQGVCSYDELVKMLK
ncbi:putative DsbA family dithiol-disulfide isomerase [Anaerosolibacter carboniphilus]|uniref:Putative DsbA family dithiol-disulfide isomerase n=1 Tax=Anaerosolibacter carboniphilus TaxID=1417629 RepID=A0A841L1N7_9FIRM|nr:DsbA family protein [Anaerosolibacter carboniphilus]MBB6216275.1 putative DsbA family dithiol-disulfide isomerase [Anaerosolibacter carboniphilus]